MIHADLHTHTCYSHGCNTPAQMYQGALNKGLCLIGFSEHSPRPQGFDYTHEYREHLSRHLPDYAREVLQLKKTSEKIPMRAGEHSCNVLFGMEMDWLTDEEDFISRACKAYPYDYLIGSVHFLDHWGFDDVREPWDNASQEQCEKWYEQYFMAWKNMLASGMFNIAAHPDLIKIFSVSRFHAWLSKPESMSMIHDCLLVLRDSGMAMEVSTAGLRKACNEFYPCPAIMELASQLHLPVSLASDAHCQKDVGHAFNELESYVKSYGFDRQAIFEKGKMTFLSI